MTMWRRWVRAALVMGAASVLGSGCALTTMQTSRQLDGGEVVASGMIDEPGAAYLPRVAGQLTYGWGLGDVSIHAGTALLTANAGVGARLYLTDLFTAEVQGDALITPMIPEGFTVLTVTPRLTTTTSASNVFYGGVQGTALFGSEREQPLEFGAVLFGAVGGLEVALGRHLTIQVEGTFSPLYYNPDLGLGAFAIDSWQESSDFGPFILPGFFQIGLGLHYFSKGLDDFEPRGRTPAPTTGRPDRRDGEQESPRTRQAEEDPAAPPPPPPPSPPSYDDDGVPLY